VIAAVPGDWEIVDMKAGPSVGSWWGWGGPQDWEYLIRNLDGLVTFSFHETIFAVKHGTPVVSVDAESKRVQMRTGHSKLRFLHETLGSGRWAYFNAIDRDDHSAQAMRLLGWLAEGKDEAGAGAVRTAELGAIYARAVEELAR
jgi:hypothetical protein